MAGDHALIELEGLNKVFYTEEVETHALSNIDLSIRTGEFVSIAGPSGCGKTTLQAFNLIGDLTVYENVELPLTYRGMAGSERKERVQAALERVGMAHRMGHYPSQLSGGQQQRVAVARAIVGRDDLHGDARSSLRPLRRPLRPHLRRTGGQRGRRPETRAGRSRVRRSLIGGQCDAAEGC